MPSYEQVKAGYAALWRDMSVRPGVLAAANSAARQILNDRARYAVVEAATGVPWFFIACLHHRESGRDFDTYLGNGEPLSRVTRLVPKGRGPFATWEQGAADALTHESFGAIADWPVERIGYCMEQFNGWGYLGKTNSPYLWAGSTLYSSGKYVADHRYDSAAIDRQLGGMVVLSRLSAISPEIAARLKDGSSVAARTVAASNTARPPDPRSGIGKTAIRKTGAVSAAVTAGGAASASALHWSGLAWPIALCAAIVAAAVCTGLYFFLTTKGSSP